MTITEAELKRAEARFDERLHSTPTIVAARYDGRRRMIEVTLSTGMMLVIPKAIIQGLEGASTAALRNIEIEAFGLGLHWPGLDADLYLPGLMQGQTGTRRYMAALLGAKGGASKSEAKAEAARRNGRSGGRPRKTAV